MIKWISRMNLSQNSTSHVLRALDVSSICGYDIRSFQYNCLSINKVVACEFISSGTEQCQTIYIAAACEKHKTIYFIEEILQKIAVVRKI